jgi:hypothetical protein
MKPESP